MYIWSQNGHIINFDSYLNSDIYKHAEALDNGKSFNYIIVISYYDCDKPYPNYFAVATYTSPEACSKVFKSFWNALKNGENFFEFPKDTPELRSDENV